MLGMSNGQPKVVITVIPRGIRSISAKDVTNQFESEFGDSINATVRRTFLGMGNAVKVTLPLDANYRGDRYAVNRVLSVLSSHSYYVKDVKYPNHSFV